MKLTIDIVTLFPKMLTGFLTESIVGEALRKGLLEVEVWNLRDFGEGPHKIVDDYPFGGGAGMVLKAGPIWNCIHSLKKTRPAAKVIYMSPDGQKLTNKIIRRLAEEQSLILLSGHYEGIDQRIRDHIIDEEISIGDYVLTNGTLPAAVLVDGISRYIPGVLGEEKSLTQDAFHTHLLSFPQYTRPSNFEGMSVPEVLLSGNHAAIEKWRQEWREKKTRELRPDLLL